LIAEKAHELMREDLALVVLGLARKNMKICSERWLRRIQGAWA